MKYQLKNHMEDIVERIARKYIDQTDMCRCEKCVADVMALALNKLTPVYVVTDTGSLFASIDSTYLQNQIDAEVAVLKAIHMVKNAPRH